VSILLTTPTSCEVTAVFTIEGSGAAGIEHRVQAPAGVQVELLGAGGVVADPRDVVRRGATLAYTVPPDRGAAQSYELRYRVTQSEEWAYRCPIWLPAVPADGRSRSVRLQVQLPPGAVPRGGSLPAFTWAGGRGVTTIGHLPSFVRVPHATADYAPRGAAAWDLPRAMDTLAVVVLTGATAFWVWRRGRRRRTGAGDGAPGHAGTGKV
jgi:hypothetical protein